MKTKDARFVIKTISSEVGDGLFAAADIKKGDFILEYTGEKIPTSVADDDHPSRYLFEIDEKWTVDGASMNNTARYINHSCDPNTEAEIDEKDRIMISAIKDIRKGEELTIDYGQEYFDEFIKPIGCKCSAKKHLR